MKETIIERAWIELHMDSLAHNVKILKEAMPSGCELMAVVKADAYGHGALKIAAALQHMNIRAFAVATPEEGIFLRRNGIQGDILILGYTPPEMAKELARYDLTPTLIDYPYAISLNRQGYPVKAHIKIDTGMHRLGFSPREENTVIKAFGMKNLQIKGIFTHLCAADSLEPDAAAFTYSQIRKFYQLLELLKDRHITIPKVHIQSSYGFMNYPELKCSYIRAGIALYGVRSRPQDKTRQQLDFRPVLSLKTRVILVRQIPEGESVGYGREFLAKRNTRLAILPIGYADGIPATLSCGRGQVLLHGKQVPIAGRICMDQMAVDVTDVENVKVGDVVTVLGWDGDTEITAPQMADAAGTIANELLSRLGKRMKIFEK